ncbi:MAG: hypothetical protein ACREFP_17050, partial [Acetobacteraceae bacterium]
RSTPRSPKTISREKRRVPRPYTGADGRGSAARVQDVIVDDAVMAGEIVPADTLVAGFDELLETGKTESWRLREDHGELSGWVELFAFSDRPEALPGLLDRLPATYRYPRSLQRLLSALSKSPHESALALLEALSRRDPRMFAEHDWVDAVIKLGTEESARALLAHICDGDLTGARGFDGLHLSNHLARLGQEFPEIKSEMVPRYEGLRPGQPKSTIESALIELADESTVLTLIGCYAADRRAYDGRLAQVFRKVALGQRPAEGWGPGAYEEFSVSLTALRRQLLAISHSLLLALERFSSPSS